MSYAETRNKLEGYQALMSDIKRAYGPVDTESKPTYSAYIRKLQDKINKLVKELD